VTEDDETPPEGAGRSLDAGAFREAVEAVGRPVVTASQLARELGWTQAETADALEALVESGRVGRADTGGDPVVFYPAELDAFADPERVILFPDRREVIVEHPAQFTRARLNQFAHLVDTNREGAYIYEIREEDVWLAPFDAIEDLLRTMHDTLGQRSPALSEFVERQWARARKFALVTREDYTVLEAASADLMGNVARQKLDDDLLHGLISDTEAWVHEGEDGEVKRALYDAGYPVQDLRDLETGDPLDVDLELRLREYQREWVEEFEERGAGVLVGPPGSGKTVAAIGAMARVGGETLVLVPSRELATQWREELLTNTSLTAEQVGEYHGGTKEIRPVTIATYQTAGMDRHRTLFEDRRWGLIVYDEVHHVSAPVWRRSTDLQAKHRLGLSVDGDTIVPVRREGEIRTQRIDEFVDEYLENDGEGYASVEGVETLGVTREGSVVWTPVTGAMRHENDSEMLTVRARNGREVTVTEDHSLMVFDGDTGSIESRRPRDLTGNDHLLQPAGMPIDGGIDTDVTLLEVDEVREAEDRESVYDISTGTGTFLGDRLFCHNSATPVREDDNEREIFTLIGPPIGTDWSKLFEAGYVAEPEVEIRFVEWPDETVRNEYAAAHGHERRQVAATNPAKVDATRELLAEHDGAKALVFVEYLEHGRQLAAALAAPFVSGETPHAERERLFREFRGGERGVLVVSRVGDEGIDLPNAEVAIVASGLGGSRRQGAQRAGRTMRPEGTARMYVLATRGTTEEDFARRQIRHLASKGVRVVERDARTAGDTDGDDSGDADKDTGPDAGASTD
jgi:superfamily II DNA or RNA helicase